MWGSETELIQISVIEVLENASNLRDLKILDAGKF